MGLPPIVTLFLCVLSALSLSHQDDVIAKRVYLKTPASYMNLTSEQWKIDETVEELLVAVRFHSRSAVGQILSLRTIKSDGSLGTKLTIGLSDGYLQVDLYNQDSKSILQKPWNIIYMNQSTEHSVAVRINRKRSTFSYSVEKRSEHVADISESIDWSGSEVVVTLGGGDSSVIGCVSLVAVQLGGGSPVSRVISLNQSETEPCPTTGECESRDCGKGTCLPLEIATCDCYGTDKTGPNCRNEPRTISLDNAAEDAETQANWLKYAPWEEERIRRIAMEFKFKDDDNSEGVLVYGRMKDDVTLKMYVVERLGSLRIGDATPLNFTLVPNIEFHSLEILFTESDLTLTVDGATQRTDYGSRPSFSSIIFGSSLPSDGVSEVGLTACIRNCFVDHHDVVDMMYNGDSRALSSQPLRSCSSNDDVITLAASTMFAADPIPKPIGQKPNVLENMQEEETADSEENTDAIEEKKPESEAEKIGTAGLFPSPSKHKDPSTTGPCEKSQSYVCQNGASCVRETLPESTVSKCVCLPGYGGKHCQFVILPRHCSEAQQFYRILNGPARLDSDASSKLAMSVAECSEGVTTVPHDMPTATPIRDASYHTHSLFLLSYRDFPAQKLESLINTSGQCTQSVEYSCNKAPLGFADNRTRFTVASANRTVTQMGFIPNSCLCLDTGCKSQGKCNCDAGGIAADGGVMKNELAGITSVVALHHEGAVSGTMSIGPLQCTGFAGETAPIRFASRYSLAVGQVSSQSISLHFRTSDASGQILSIGGDHDTSLVVRLIDGHTMIVKKGDDTITVDSQAKLNDTNWHLLVLEWSEYEVRLSVDNSHAFGKMAAYGGVLRLGDEELGFIGCLRSLLINNQKTDLHSLVKEDALNNHIFLSCDSHCSPSQCRNGGDCFEDFANGAAVCRCRYPAIQSGINCEIDINTNSSVSFHGGYLMYNRVGKPLEQDIVMSFRTDQSEALLLFAHDHLNNFIQVHLKDEVNLTLSLNNGQTVHSCTVTARPGTEYGDMRWIQLSISHSSMGSQLSVDDDACTIREARSLSTETLRAYNNWNLDLVKIPVGLGGSNDNLPFMRTFVGGVERVTNTRGGSIHLHPEYQTDVPDLLGCLRGFRVGEEVVDLRHTSDGYRPEDPALVRLGCDVRCDTLQCMNGGHCSVGWRDYDPSKSRTSCDCSRTSYAGPSCTLDDGLKLTAGNSFSFKMDKVLARYIEPSRPLTQTFKFAFSSSATKTRQMLAKLYFKDGKQFEVLINKNASINVAISGYDGRTMVETFKGNYTDGYRHFFVAQFASDSATAVMLDSIRRDFPYRSSNLDLFHSTKLMVGDQMVSSQDTFESSLEQMIPKRPFDGCVSNIQLDLGVSALDLWPLSYLSNQGHTYANLSSISPLGSIVNKGSCAAFRVPNQPPVLQNIVSLPAWETNFRRLEYRLEESEDDGTGLGWWWLLIAAIIILTVLLIACCLYMLCCRKSKNNTANTQQSLDERKPLHQSEYPMPPPIASSPVGKGTSNYRIPPPDMELTAMDNKRASSWQSGASVYYTAPEDSPSESEDLDRTIVADDEEFILVDRPTTFDRSVPHRMSSFRNLPQGSHAPSSLLDGHAPPTIQAPLFTPPPMGDTPTRRPRPVTVPVPPPLPPPRAN